jgi:hypothetical protein
MAKKNNVLKKLCKGYLLASTIYTGVKFVQCRGIGKEDDRHMIGRAIDRMSGLSVECDNIITIDDTDMHVSYNPYLQLFTNSLGGVAVVINGTTEVYTDAQYRRMSPDTQRAILAHELGHYKCNHKPGITYQFDRAKAIMHNTVLDMELEADAYACKVVGPNVMINALKELSTIKGVSKKELKLRIHHIKSNIRYRMGYCDNTGKVLGYIIYNGYHKEVGREEV